MTDDYTQPILTFRHFLVNFQERSALANPDPSTLQSLFLELQSYFQQVIMGLEATQQPGIAAAHWQTFQTESNRQLRLLGTDVMFLQAARQPTTAQRRQAQMGDRLTTLIQYCDALLDRA